MLPLLLKSNVSRLGATGAPLSPRIESEIDNHLGYINASLGGRDYLLSEALTGADIQLSFVGELAGLRTDRAIYPKFRRAGPAFPGTPCYKAASARGGPYSFAS